VEEKVGKVFMNIRLNKYITFARPVLTRWTTVWFFIVLGCSPDYSDDNIPPVNFPDIVIVLNLPSYSSLMTKGGFKEIGGGVRGIIVYCEDVGKYHAFERNCSYQPNDACATVNIDASKLFMIDPCCGSSFDFSTGNPIGGVAWRPLRKYQTTVTGNELTITEVVVD
jgi:nitrite reductase/ring-hydroxylating ferredoxin subunit